MRMITSPEETEANRAQIEKDAQQMLIDEILKLEAASSVVNAGVTGARRRGNLLTIILLWTAKMAASPRDNGIDADSILTSSLPI